MPPLEATIHAFAGDCQHPKTPTTTAAAKSMQAFPVTDAKPYKDPCVIFIRNVKCCHEGLLHTKARPCPLHNQPLRLLLETVYVPRLLPALAANRPVQVLLAANAQYCKGICSLASFWPRLPHCKSPIIPLPAASLQVVAEGCQHLGGGKQLWSRVLSRGCLQH